MSILAEELIEYINEGLSEVFLKTEDTVNLKFHDFVEDHDNYVVAEFYGGINGLGNWANYLTAITEVVTILNSDYKCWLVDLHNDCLDDVFYLKLGIQQNDNRSN